MNIRIDKSSPMPIHAQIEEQIKGLIQSGRLRAGDQLPTMRALSIDLAVNFNTVAHAYRELDHEGVIATERGRGTFVKGTLEPAEAHRIRQQKLNELIRAMLDETERLGYTAGEVRQAIEERAGRVQDGA